MAPPLLHLRDVSLRIGSQPLLDGAELSVSPGERVALVGRNGSGKSTLLRVAAGLVEPESGERFLQPGTRLAVLAQEPSLAGHGSVLAYVEAGLAPEEAHRGGAALEALGLTGAEDPARLSGGEARRAALARALAPEPDLLLLDEPTNHLDLPAIAWLEEHLSARRGALVLVSHDRRFLSALSRATVWLDRGRTRRLERGFAAFESWRDEVLAEEERDAHELSRRIAREEDWMRYGVTARRKRNVRRVSELAALREARRSRRAPIGAARLEAAASEGSGSLVALAEGVSKALGGRALVRDLSLRVTRGDRLALVGPNGAGKTTLLRLLTGDLEPDAGRVRLGANLVTAVLDQGRADLAPGLTLAGALSEGRGDTVLVGGRPRHVIGYMREYLFPPEQARSPVSSLSGGERARLLLARALARGANLLVLDEPTNDLDLETLDLLQEVLGDFPGTVLLVSHDRDFLDRVATSVLASEGEGRWVEYAGGYSDMLAQRGAAVPARPSSPGASARPAPPPREASPPRAPAPPPRLTMAEQEALRRLPGEIERLSAEAERLRAILADPDLYARDAARFSAATRMLAEREVALSAAEDRWLQIEEKRESIGA